MSKRAGCGLALLCLVITIHVLAQGPKKAVPNDKDLEPRLVTLQEKDITLADALKVIEKQTSIKVEDRRRDNSRNPKLKFDLDKVPFWRALEAVAKQSDLRVSLHERDRKLALIDHDEGYRQMPIAFDGLFRATVWRIDATRVLELDFPRYVAQVEIAWEPRYQAYVIQAKPDTIIAQAKGRTLKLPDDESAPVEVNLPSSMNIEMRIPAVPRSTTQIDVLKGELKIIGSTRMLEFKFDKLDEFAKAKEVVQKQEGVTVRLREFRTEKEIWTIGLRLEYPDDGPKFESFQSWLVRNQIFLEDKKGKRIEHNGYELDPMGNTAIARYRFVDDRDSPLGKPSDWKLIYMTPSAFTETTLKFEFKDVPLP